MNTKFLSMWKMQLAFIAAFAFLLLIGDEMTISIGENAKPMEIFSVEDSPGVASGPE